HGRNAMKKLLTCVAALCSLAAFADGDVNRRIDRGTTEVKKDATDVARELKSNVKEWERQAGFATEEQGTFKADRAYELDGTARKLSFGKLTIDRPGLPPATLSVRDRTVVLLDGKRVEAKAIPEGVPVRARFQL